MTPCACRWEERCGGSERLACLGCDPDFPDACSCEVHFRGKTTCLGCPDCVTDDRFDFGGEGV